MDYAGIIGFRMENNSGLIGSFLVVCACTLSVHAL